MRRLATIAASAGLLAAATLFAAPGQVAAADCGKLSGGTLETKGAVSSCAKARLIVKEFLKHGRHKIQGYRCKGGDAKVTCRLDEKRIIWIRS